MTIPNTITFSTTADSKEMLRLTSEGFHYNGQVIKDAGEAYNLFRQWLAAASADAQPRQWQGLTEDEINACDPHEECWNLLELARAIEAKLRDKNA